MRVTPRPFAADVARVEQFPTPNKLRSESLTLDRRLFHVCKNSVISPPRYHVLEHRLDFVFLL